LQGYQSGASGTAELYAAKAVYSLQMLRRALLTVLVASFAFAMGGCRANPDDLLVGVWTPVIEESKVPNIPIPSMQKRVDTFMRTVVLKVRSDKTFVLASAPPVEGTWTLEGDELTFTPTRGVLQGALGDMLGTMKGKLNPRRDRVTLIQPTPIGEVQIVLRKSA
jgi:hypothetical protein